MNLPYGRARICGFLLVIGGAGLLTVLHYVLYGSDLVGDLCSVYIFVVLPIGFLVIGYSVGRWLRLVVAVSFLGAWWGSIRLAVAFLLLPSGEPTSDVQWYCAIYGPMVVIVGLVPVVALGFILAPRAKSLGQCRKCQYDLRGLTEPRCPECGTSFDPDEIRKATEHGAE